MKIAVLSGKGGTGKTFVATNLAYSIKNVAYVDCDVEEPNGKLFFNTPVLNSIPVKRLIPSFDKNLCNGCRKCVDNCHFNALIYILNRPVIFKEICHACGLCKQVCPCKAIKEIPENIGVVNTRLYEHVKVIEGILNIGQVSGVNVISKAKEIGFKEADNIIIDCPPGSGCSVIEAIKDVDYCLAVTEPTSFSFENFKIIIALAQYLNKPVGIIINKYVEDYEPLIEYCNANKLNVLAKIPYSNNIAKLSGDGKIVAKYDPELKNKFIQIFEALL